MKSKLLGIVCVIAVFALSGVIVNKYLFNEDVKQDKNEEKLEQVISETFDELNADAEANFPELSENEAFQKAAISKVADNINSKTNQSAKLKEAAGTFIGFYIANQTFRADYCKALGVEIQNFVDVWETAHAYEYEKSIKILRASQSDLEKMKKIAEQQTIIVLAKDMQAAATQYNVTVNDVCQSFSDNAEAVVSEMHVSKLMPLVHTILHAN